MNSNNFKNLLEKLNIQLHSDLSTLKLKDATFIKNELEFKLILELPFVPDIIILSEFNNNFKKALLESFSCKKIIIEYVYLDKKMNEDLVESYYRFVLEALVEKNIAYKSLNHFPVSFFENEIVLSAGGDNDEKIVTPLYDNVSKSFKQLGIDFVKFSLIISPLVIPVTRIIEKGLEEDLGIGNKSFSSNINEYEKPQKLPKYLNKKSKVKVLINNIPTTESDLIEYRQINGNVEFVIEGFIVTSIIQDKGNFKLFEGVIKDGSDSIIIKTFIGDRSKSIEFYETKVTAGNFVEIKGYAEYDKYSKDVVLKIKDIVSLGIKEEDIVIDDAIEKRVELHAHSKMTFIDSVLSVESYLKRALDYGHTALAITDKNSVQGFGDLHHAIKMSSHPKAKEILPIYGIEGYYLDPKSFRITLTDDDIDLRKTSFVVYDFETTGLSFVYDEIIEIGAVKIVNNHVIDKFQSLVNPRKIINSFISELTTITNDDLRYAPSISEVLPEFKKFIEGSVLVAHNATFDNGFLIQNLKRFNIYDNKYPTIDTLNLAKIRYAHKLKRFNLEDLRKIFDVNLETHHRASDDAFATAEIFIKMCNDLFNDKIFNYNQINTLIDYNDTFKLMYPYHLTILSRTREGLVNINRIITDSHTNHLAKTPIITKEFLNNHREGLLIGSGCYHGEIFELAFNGDYQEMLKRVSFYDYLEVLPVDALMHKLINTDFTVEHLYKTIELIIKLGKETNKLVVATGDVHELNPKDQIYRKFLYDKALIGGGIHEFNRLENLPKQHFRTTSDMLNQFSFLSKDLAYEIVVTNTNKIAKMIERYDLFPKTLFAPSDNFMKKFGIESAKAEVEKIIYENAHKIYGEVLPQIITERLEKELKSIFGKSYATIYYISYLLVKHSTDENYVVGSRGSIGSSLVAYFMKITEVNSLPPHYICPKCKFSAFKYTAEEINLYKPTENERKYFNLLSKVGSGLDLDKACCPVCGSTLDSDGFDIPFETFLGVDGEKVPDIDLNFSGEYQSKAHDYCREIFGAENTFRGGTIGTIADKTAENYVTSYYMKKDIRIRKCQATLLAQNLTGVKRQTGQHPGGIVIVPQGIDVNEITPVQFPADDKTSLWKTTHIDYHKFEDNLLKLDILGHDDPTMIRFLMEFVWNNPSEFSFKNVDSIPIFDKNILKLFNGVEVLNLDSKVIKSEVLSAGIPEFGTKLTKEMLFEIKPTTVTELIKISGLSHGKNVWKGNARNYFFGLDSRYGKVSFNDLICCRDDIMEHLINKGIPFKDAFQIMERVRKGKSLTEIQEALMKKYSVENWFIDSCKAIEYLFPKAHATAYVIMALRIAWFKLYKPLYYYAGFFTKRTETYDIVSMVKGIEAVSKKIDELGNNNYNFSDETLKKSFKEETSDVKAARLLVCLQVSLEMLARGYKFLNVHINYSHATDFLIEEEGLRIPLIAIDSLGETTAKAITLNRGKTSFTSINDAIRRGKINPKMAEKLTAIGAFEGLPKDDLVGLFKYI